MVADYLRQISDCYIVIGYPLGLYWGLVGIMEKENGNYYTIIGYIFCTPMALDSGSWVLCWLAALRSGAGVRPHFQLHQGPSPCDMSAVVSAAWHRRRDCQNLAKTILIVFLILALLLFQLLLPLLILPYMDSQPFELNEPNMSARHIFGQAHVT